MREQTKRTRIRVVRPFYLSRERIVRVGEELEVDTADAGALIHAGKAEALSALANEVPVSIPAPATNEVFRSPGAGNRATGAQKGVKS